jgi:hypothetical protein
VTTPLEELACALTDAASYNPATEAAPEAVLWCDAGREFASLIPALRDRLPQLLTFGLYDPATRTGPAIWLRTAVSRAVPEAAWPDGTVPILWLPGVGRETLRGAEDCPPSLQLLVWFTIAGCFFGHVNGKDWTLRGFLAAERGRLKLDIADDAESRAALAHAAPRLCAKPLAELRGRHWDAGALHLLLAPDLPADMLDWIDGRFDPAADRGRFEAFATQSGLQLGFDPRKLSRQDAVRRLARREKPWAQVWSRFAASAGDGYAGVIRLLWDESPPAELFADKSAYPAANAGAEEKLRTELLKLANASLAEAKARVIALEREHAQRRVTVWARRGDAPLAVALEHLAQIADAHPLPAQDANALAEAYSGTGWRTDWAAIQALAAAPRETDRAAVSAALCTIYAPWLEEGAIALQELARSGKLPWPKPAKPQTMTLIFVDGLRLDLARSLVAILEAEGAKASLSWTWSGFPTVTATCKPLVSPVATALRGPAESDDLLPVTAEGKPAAKPVLFKTMAEAGWATTDTLLPEGRLWTECGRFDEEGHALGARLAERIRTGLRDVADRVLQLARAGRAVRIVTDHGWLLQPGGLQQAPLESGLLAPQGKRSRCARVKPGAPTTYMQLPWTWNPAVYVAVARGARSFLAGQEYAHGGISPQECVLPIITVAPLAVHKPVTITKLRWEGLRLRIEVAGGADLQADLRLGSETSGPSLLKGPRVLDDSGKTSILVDDTHEGQTACLVMLADDGTVRAHRVVKVGEDEP